MLLQPGRNVVCRIDGRPETGTRKRHDVIAVRVAVSAALGELWGVSKSIQRRSRNSIPPRREQLNIFAAGGKSIGNVWVYITPHAP